MLKCTHTHTYACTQPHTYALTHTHTHTHMHTHTHTRTHTHTYILVHTCTCKRELGNKIHVFKLLFHQYVLTEIAVLQKKYDELVIPREEEIASYYKLRQQLERLDREMQTFIVSPKYCVPFLQPGRMVKVSISILIP